MARHKGQSSFSRRDRKRSKTELCEGPPSVSQSNFHGLVSERSHQKQSSLGPSGTFEGDQCSRSSEGHSFPGVLWQNVYNTQTFSDSGWGGDTQMAYDYRPFRVEPIHREPYFSYGNFMVNSGFYETGYVDNFYRSQGCLLPYSYPSGLSQVHEGSSVWPGTSVQGNAHGVSDFSQGIHQVNQGSDEVHKVKGLSHECLHGRLVEQTCESGDSEQADYIHSEAVCVSRASSQSSEVRTRTGSEQTVCRGSVRFIQGSSVSSTGQVSSVGTVDNSDFERRRLLSESLVQVDRQDEQFDQSDKIGGVESQTNTETNTNKMESGNTELEPVCSSRGMGQTSFNVVDGQEEHFTGGSTSSISTGSCVVHGCQSMGIRGHSRQSINMGSVVPGGSKSPFQQSGNVSNHKGCRGIPECNQEFQSVDLHGQFHNGGNNQSSGGYQIMESNRSSLGSMDKNRLSKLHGEGPSHSGEVQCEGGRNVQDEQSDIFRVVHKPKGSSPNMEYVGNAPSGHVCDEGQSQTALFCIPSPGHSGMESECASVQLDKSVCVPLSPVGHNGRSVTKNPGRGGRGNSDRPLVGKETMVPSTSRSTNSRSLPNSKSSRSFSTRTLGSNVQRSRSIQSSCVASIRESSRKKGFSDKVASRIAKSVRKSSLTIYNSKWQRFCRWCEVKRIEDPLKVDVTQLAEFLNDLFENEDLQVRTIKGYRSAIARMIKLSGGLDLSEDPYLHALISNFSIERPVNTKKYPTWDLIKVLNSLRKEPYEPMHKCTLTDLTKKLVFLLLLASGARRGELHAIDVRRTAFTSNQDAVWLRPSETFIAKNFNVQTGKGEFVGIKINSLKQYVGTDLKEEWVLCPVRCLRYYMKRTEKIRENISQLLITVKKNDSVKPAHKNTISGWMKGVIAKAYEIEERSKDPVLRRATHEIRAQAASFALYANVSVDQILQTCRWSQTTTFTSYYLRDMIHTQDGEISLPPLMSAGAVIHDADRQKRRGGSKRPQRAPKVSC